ncbi:MAG: M28 family peptidase [Acidobacteria bacterium]|nr:M28 family peptidase [Acidobacteriota bacterium]
MSDKVSSPAAVGPTPPVSAVSAATAEQQKSTDFNGDKAFAHVKAQVEFGPRPAGSAALDKTRDYILKELKSYGLKTTVDEFTPVTPKGRIKMKNIVAELPGESSGVIIISSHYDTKEYKQFKFLGANDGGSSTGALLEIARVMAADKKRESSLINSSSSTAKKLSAPAGMTALTARTTHTAAAIWSIESKAKAGSITSRP